MRPGFGDRHPMVVALIDEGRSIAAEVVTWPGGIRLHVTAYASPYPLVPDELVTSVRCITRVDEGLVVCQTPDGTHLWPGGRRLVAETFGETARRELHEETGWHIDAEATHKIGLLHFELLDPQPDDHPLPHPDFFQIVLTARAVGRDANATDWADTDGWEISSKVVSSSDIRDVITSHIQRAFIDLLPST